MNARGGDDARVSEVSRRLRARADGMLAEAWFMPEARTGLRELGIGPAATMFGGRIAPLGPIPGVAAGALLVPVHPDTVARAVDQAWSSTTPPALLAEREHVATGHLRSILAEAGAVAADLDRAAELARRAADAGTVSGHPLTAAHRVRGWTGDPLVDLWRACERIRERRHESHRNAWTAAGVDPCELCVLTDLWRGALVSSMTGTWPAAERAEALVRLRARGWADDHAATDAGREAREAIELATDAQESEVVAALGADADELLVLLAPWSSAVVEWAGSQLGGS